MSNLTAGTRCVEQNEPHGLYQMSQCLFSGHISHEKGYFEVLPAIPQMPYLEDVLLAQCLLNKSLRLGQIYDFQNSRIIVPIWNITYIPVKQIRWLLLHGEEKCHGYVFISSFLRMVADVMEIYRTKKNDVAISTVVFEIGKLTKHVHDLSLTSTFVGQIWKCNILSRYYPQSSDDYNDFKLFVTQSMELFTVWSSQTRKAVDCWSLCAQRYPFKPFIDRHLRLKIARLVWKTRKFGLYRIA